MNDNAGFVLLSHEHDKYLADSLVSLPSNLGFSHILL